MTSVADSVNIRAMLVPDPGYILFECDYEKADVCTVIWEADDDALKAMFREDPSAFYDKATAHLDMTYSLRKRFVHLCVDRVHEALTPKGWVPVEEKPKIILIVDRSGRAYWDRVDWHEEKLTEPHHKLIHFHGESYNQMVTPAHSMPYHTDDSGAWKVRPAEDLPRSARLPKACMLSTDMVIPENVARLAAACRADGSIDRYGNVTFHFRKERKIERLRILLSNIGHSENKNGDGTTTFYVPRRNTDPYWAFRVCDSTLLQWSAQSLIAFLEEGQHWDGHLGPTKAMWTTTKERETQEWLNTLAHLVGKSSQMSSQNGYYRVSLNNRPYARLARMDQDYYPLKNRWVFCPITRTGLWLTRRDGNIAVTGNTNYGGKARTAAMGCGISIAEAQREQDAWFRKHPGIRAWHDRTWRALQGNPPQITNRFGFRKLYWGAPDDAMLREALAWQPQSHVALCTGAAHIAIDTELSWVEVLLDGHDSIVGQMPIARWEDRDEIRKRMEITVPYEDPLVMVAGIKASDKSWGDCQPYAWR